MCQARRVPARHRARLPGPVVDARRGQPSLPPLLAAPAARGRARRRLADAPDDVVQRAAAGAGGGRAAGRAPAAAPTRLRLQARAHAGARVAQRRARAAAARSRPAGWRAAGRCRPGCRCWRSSRILRPPADVHGAPRRDQHLARGDPRRERQPRLPAPGDHRARVDGTAVSRRDGAGRWRRFSPARGS